MDNYTIGVGAEPWPRKVPMIHLLREEENEIEIERERRRGRCGAWRAGGKGEGGSDGDWGGGGWVREKKVGSLHCCTVPRQTDFTLFLGISSSSSSSSSLVVFLHSLFYVRISLSVYASFAPSHFSASPPPFLTSVSIRRSVFVSSGGRASHLSTLPLPLHLRNERARHFLMVVRGHSTNLWKNRREYNELVH
jgi:hypothetical protein